MQITRLVTFLLVWMTYAQYSSSSGSESDTDIVEGIICVPIDEKIIAVVRHPSKCIIQNIGTVTVEFGKLHKIKLVTKPGDKEKYGNLKRTLFSNRLELCNRDSHKRAILYISYLEEQFIEKPFKGYDKNKILKYAFTLGVKYIPEKCETFDTLISYFWSEDENVWLKIFNAISDLLEPEDRSAIYHYVLINMETLKTHLETLIKLTKNSDPRSFQCYQLIEQVLNLHANFFKSVESEYAEEVIMKLYMLPFYSNIITLKMYFYAIVAARPQMIGEDNFNTEHAWQTLYQNNSGAVNYISALRAELPDYLYRTTYAGGLYNVMMNAYTHLALHGLDMFHIWRQIYYKIADDYDHNAFVTIDRYKAISYSNFYGRATPDLLYQAIHIRTSSLNAYYTENKSEAAKLLSISFNIINGIVCGLRLRFLPEFITILGTYKKKQSYGPTLTLSNHTKIIGLDVYKTTYIRCLNFTVSDNSSRLFGENCLENSEHSKFQLKDHYINSLYLANDYPKTRQHFDNIAVSYLPIPVKVLL